MFNQNSLVKRLLTTSVGVKFSIVVCGVVLLMGTATTWLIESRASKAIHAEHQERALTIARNLAGQCAYLLLTKNRVKLREVIGKVQTQERDIYYIYVTDSDENIFAHTFEGEKIPQTILGANPLHGKAFSHAHFSFEDGGVVHEISFPVMGGAEGEIHLGLSELPIRRKIDSLRHELLLLSGGICLAGVFSALFFARFIVKPLEVLANASDKFGQGKFVHDIPVVSDDEIGRLTANFNQMVENIESAKEKQELVEDALRVSRDQWAKTFDAMSDIVTIQDKDMRILMANKAAYVAFDAGPGEIEGKYCYEVFRESNKPCLNCPELETLKVSKTHSANITHGNLGKVFHVTSSPVLDKDGEFIHLVHIAKDITENKKMEAELFQAHKMEAIGTLAGGIAHDFNNILAAILGFGELAKVDLPEGSQSRRYIDQVLIASHRATELVRQILTFSRKGKESSIPMNPSTIIKEAVKMLRSSLPSTVTIHEEIDSNCGFFNGNPTNVHQVLVNLCTNALHAMEKEKGTLGVKLSRKKIDATEAANVPNVYPGMFVELSVSDTGKGIEPEIIDRIFEPYFTTKGVGKGSGMGLALVLGIVQNNGGFVRVDSVLGQGTTFQVYWPLIDTKGEVEEEEEGGTVREGTGRVLVVDDEEDLVAMYTDSLGQLGYTVTSFFDSRKALEVFKESPDTFDIIVTDQTMPHITGMELVDAIRQIRADIPIILSTGYSSMVSEEEAREAGVDFLMKPVSIEDLAAVVRDALEKAKVG